MAPSTAAGTTGLERVLLIFLMKNQQIKLQRTKPSPANDRSSNQSVKNSQTPKNFQKHNHNSTPIDSDVETFTETCDLSTNLLLLHQNSRFTGQKHERTVKSSIYGLKLALTAKNFNSPNKNSNERGKTSNHRPKLKQTVKNLNPPNKSSNER